MEKILLSGFADEIDNDFETQLKTVTGLGMHYICLRSAYGKNICDYTPQQVQTQLLPLLQQYGVQISSIGSPIGKIFADDEPGFHKTLSTCQRTVEIANILNCRYVRLFSFYIPKNSQPALWRGTILAKMRQILDIFGAAGITALHENEKDIYGDTALRCKDLLDALACPHFKAIFDFANFVQCQEDPLACYTLLQPYIAYFHIKDARKDSAENVVCGTGDGDIAKILRIAVSTDGYQGFMTLEPHLVLFDALQSLELADATDIIRTNKASSGQEAYALQYQALKAILNGL
ncbi:MAG: sugar phosphate isomerase/epimerase [Gemmiger sp.]|nr:sugar phosphate isomerase/epimerase [Gemmiger sp.]